MDVIEINYKNVKVKDVHGIDVDVIDMTVIR